MRYVVLVGCRGRVLLLFQVLIDLVRCHADALQDIALPQQTQRELLAHAVAVRGIVDALGGERLGQFRKLDVILLRDFLQCIVQGLVRNLHAGLVRPLQLDLLEDQPLEHLLAQHVLRRQFELLAAQALGDGRDLLIKLAGEDHAVVDDRRHAIEQLAFGGELAGLGECEALYQQSGGEYGKNALH